MVMTHTHTNIIRLLMFWFSIEFSDYGATIVALSVVGPFETYR